jgi:hypothetical protein
VNEKIYFMDSGIFAVFMQLLIPIGVQAANEDYFVINTLEASPGGTHTNTLSFNRNKR